MLMYRDRAHLGRWRAWSSGVLYVLLATACTGDPFTPEGAPLVPTYRLEARGQLEFVHRGSTARLLTSRYRTETSHRLRLTGLTSLGRHFFTLNLRAPELVRDQRFDVASWLDTTGHWATEARFVLDPGTTRLELYAADSGIVRLTAVSRDWLSGEVDAWFTEAGAGAGEHVTVRFTAPREYDRDSDR